MVKDTQIFYDIGLSIAEIAHTGQYRHDKKTPYIFHPLALARMFEDPLDMAVAVLHDVVEDTPWTLDDIKKRYMERLEDEGYDWLDYVYELEYILKGVFVLTHKDREPYDDYINRIIGTVYVKFKIGDITINLADTPTERQKVKYTKAIKKLLKDTDMSATQRLKLIRKAR